MLQFGKINCLFELNLKYFGCEKKPLRLFKKNLKGSKSLILPKIVSYDIGDLIREAFQVTTGPRLISSGKPFPDDPF